MASFAKIARAVAKASARAGLDLPATLIKYTTGTRTTGAVSAGTNPTAASYTARGWIADYATNRIDGTIIKIGDQRISLLAATLSVTPEPTDIITIAGASYRVINVSRDPATAVYQCQARGPVAIPDDAWSSGFSSGFGG